jgi:hypothetical protein
MRITLVKYYDIDPTTGAVNRLIEGYCDSTETKPTTGIADGSTLLETDTGDLYVFNEAGAAWVKYMALKE